MKTFERCAMPTRSSEPDVLVDTSVAVAFVLRGHPHNEVTVRTLKGRRLGLAGHAAFETFSVLTRLPAPDRQGLPVVAQILTTNFPGTRHLSARGAEQLLRHLVELEIAGGSVYDALVGATAVEHEVPLVTADRRALDTYRRLGVNFELVPST